MLFFGYSPFPPYLQYHVAGPDGALVRTEPIDLPWPTMMHDFAITKDHVVFMLCPIVFSFDNIKQRGSVFSWEPERGTKLGVMPRNGGNADVRWFDTDPCYVFHPMNAYDEDGKIVLDVARYRRLDFILPEAARDPKYRDQNMAKMHRWTIDLRGGVRSTPLDDLAAEFPRVDERLVGRRHRFGYAAVREPAQNDGGLPFWSSVRKYDLERNRTETRAFGDRNGVGEPIFVPRSDAAAEDDGWVLALCYDEAANGSDFFILDARDIAGEPVARIRLPHRVPYGFHGNWAPGVA
jgi:carotenoid cleavage dioxygenase